MVDPLETASTVCQNKAKLFNLQVFMETLQRLSKMYSCRGLSMMDNSKYLLIWIWDIQISRRQIKTGDSLASR